MTKQIVIKLKDSDVILAEGELGKEVNLFEGNYYFTKDTVNEDLFKLSDYKYVCSYKGTCDYYNVEADGKQIENVCWVYEMPESYEEEVKGKYGFPAYSQDEVVVE